LNMRQKEARDMETVKEGSTFSHYTDVGRGPCYRVLGQ
jgi:hypothetical protein